MSRCRDYTRVPKKYYNRVTEKRASVRQCCQTLQMKPEAKRKYLHSLLDYLTKVAFRTSDVLEAVMRVSMVTVRAVELCLEHYVNCK